MQNPFSSFCTSLSESPFVTSIQNYIQQYDSNPSDKILLEMGKMIISVREGIFRNAMIDAYFKFLLNNIDKVQNDYLYETILFLNCRSVNRQIVFRILRHLYTNSSECAVVSDLDLLIRTSWCCKCN